MGLGIIPVTQGKQLCPRVTNDYSAPLAPHSLDQEPFLPLSNMKFGGQDYHMKQSQKTLAYARALQYLVEKTQLLPLGEPH